MKRENTAPYSSHASQQHNPLYAQQISTLTTDTQKIVEGMNQEISAQNQIVLSARQMLNQIRT